MRLQVGGEKGPVVSPVADLVVLAGRGGRLTRGARTLLDGHESQPKV